MSYLFSMFSVMVIGMVILMTGIVMMDKGFGETPQGAMKASLAWGAGFFVSFGAELLTLLKVL